MTELQKLAIVALLSGSLGAAGAYAINQPGHEAEQQQAMVAAASGILAKVSPDCLAKVQEVGASPSCVIGKAFLGNDTTESTGWLCNGAWMPKAVQDCLTEAVGK